LGLEYIELAPGFVREVVDVYDAWEGRESVPMKIQELTVLRIEVSRLYKSTDVRRQESDKPKTVVLKDTRLD